MAWWETLVRSGAVVCLAVTAIAQAPNAEQPVFRTGIQLVQVDVVVQHDGQPVLGLTKDDFRIKDNGKPQPISVFSIREADPAGPVLRPVPPGWVTNWPVAPGVDPVSATVILIDGQNTAFADQAFARSAALKYLDEHARRRDMIAIYSLGTTLKVAQPFTTDRDALHAALDKWTAEVSLNQGLDDPITGIFSGLAGNAVNAAIANANQRRAAITSYAFAEVARQLEGLPGRKKLVWITAALPLTFTQDTSQLTPTMGNYINLSPQLYEAARILNDANVAIYPVDPRGAIVSRTDPGITTMIRLAEKTGGKAFYGNNDVSTGIAEAVSDTDVTYTLGFYPADDQLDGSFHSISVEVARGGAEVRYRQGYTAGGRHALLTDQVRQRTLNGFVRDALDATHIQIRAHAEALRHQPGYFNVEITVDPAGLQLAQGDDGIWTGKIEVAIVPDGERKPKGLHQDVKIKLTPERFIEARSKGIVVSNVIRVTNKKNDLLSDALKVVVMDWASGKAGSVRVPIP